MAERIIDMCVDMGAKFAPITGKELDSEEFVTMIMRENEIFDANQALTFANALQQVYGVCTGGKFVIENKMKNLLENIGTLKNNGIDDYTIMELDLARKRKILTILVPKVLSNNEFGST